MTSVTDPTGRTTRYGYGIFDQVTSVKVGERNADTSEVVETRNKFQSFTGRKVSVLAMEL